VTNNEKESYTHAPQPENGSAALLNGHYAAPPADRDGKTWVRSSVIVQAEPGTLFELWMDVERAPEWHERIVSVEKTGPNTARWVMRDEDGDNEIEWDFEILKADPGKRVVWRSTRGEPENAGEVIFEPAFGGRGTVVTILQQFRIGKVGRLWEAITGRDPKQSAVENLRNFKALAETGEIPRSHPQPHGDRGLSGRVKRSLYGENTPDPAHTDTVDQHRSADEGSK
jgi:uncharacterized membrane protein